MGNVKYADESVKYLIKARIEIDGVVNKSDIVGALFGQTEGLLDRDMEIKHLQRTGRIGRIDLNIHNRSGSTKGSIEVPSSLNKIETAIIAATIESVDRVGACGCSIKLDKIVDVRKDKLERITKRAAEIMKQWDIDEQSDNMDISKIVEKEAKRGKIVSFGYENLPAGPGVYSSDELILVEGRADISNLLKMGIENTIALGGTNVPDTIKHLCQNRKVTALLDGDRGGDMILKELILKTEIEYVARAPKGKEIEHLDMDLINKTLSNKKHVVESRFISEDLPIVEFIKKNKRWKYLDKKGQEIHERHKSENEKTRKSRSSDRKSKSKSRSRSKRDRKSKSRRGKGSKRRSDKSKKSRRPQVPNQVKDIIKNTQQTMNAVFVDDSFETQLTVSTSEVFDKLQAYSGSITTLIIDGVISQRLLSLAAQKSVKLVAGAKLGDINDYPKKTQYVTFNRI